ncbi:hypothetical protein KKJ06_20115 [Xenorhabdus bovienii]|uniref:hypothetical protein n=1 Tax=Xenorhabdus bovienii TaxID=40576 RepID=UPI0023B329E8|nr:hypothetical protein [Xenorhabdus bovienii]MDE9557659.1 hypothetical protein [Xenorhabdus bovienii]
MKFVFDSEEELFEALKVISPEILTDFFSARVNELIVCPICKSEKINIPYYSGRNEPNQPAKPRHAIPSRHYAALYPDSFHIKDYHFRFVCANCAHEMNFSVSVIVDWLRGY